MATSRGSFGTSLNPFGTGSIGSFSQYDIGGNLAELKLYEISVRWQNGQATDEEYLAALRDTLTYYSEGTRDYISAKDRLDDTEYRIGRQKVEDDIDALIAFDQKWLAKLNPGSLRYRDLQQSLRSELAQRRSRDYGRMVASYNDGKTSTESLRAWVDKTVKGLTADDPDYEQWTQTRDDLDRRLQSEKDSKVYQDYQQDRISDEAFLAYIQERRNSMDPDSPDWDEWNRRLEDAQKSVDDNKQARADEAFFNAYAEGKKSDKEYLDYIQTRLSTMQPSDDEYESWRHRLRVATFSVTEDQLRFDVEHGKKPVSALISFYEGYRKTMNPASAEWRQLTEAIESWRKWGGSGGGGGGGGGSRSGGGGTTAGAGGAVPGKAIGPELSLTGALDVLRIDPTADKKDQKLQKEFFDTNYASMQNARQRGDKVWLFVDPRNPNLTTARLLPDGTPDPNGGTVRGATYLPVTDAGFATMDRIEADYYYGVAEIALADNDYKNFAKYYRYAINAEDHARLVDSQAVGTRNRKLYDLGEQAVDHYMKIGDWEAAYNQLHDMAVALAEELQNPMLDDTRRGQLEALGEKLGENPLLPKIDPMTGNIIAPGALDPNGLAEGRFDLGPGWHHVLDKTDNSGRPVWGITYDDLQDGSWELEHRTVATNYGGTAVVGEVKLGEAQAGPLVLVKDDGGQVMLPAPKVDFIHFTDEHGQVVRGYSIDGGTTWIKPEAGTVPLLELTDQNGNPTLLTKTKDQDGNEIYTDDQGEVMATLGADGSIEVSDAAIGRVGWYGQRRYEAASRQVNEAVTKQAIQNRRLGAELTGEETQRRVDQAAARERVATGKDSIAIGAPGQRMTLTTAKGGDQVINLIGASRIKPSSYYLDDGGDRNIAELGRAEITKARERAQRDAAARNALEAQVIIRGAGFNTGNISRLQPSAPPAKPLPKPTINKNTGFTVPALKPAAAPKSTAKVSGQIHGTSTGDISFTPKPAPAPKPAPKPAADTKKRTTTTRRTTTRRTTTSRTTGTGTTNRRSTGV